MKARNLKLLPLLIFVAAGCNSEPPSTMPTADQKAVATSSPVKDARPDSGSHSASGDTVPAAKTAVSSPTASKTSETSPAPKPAASTTSASSPPSSVPPALKSEGYEYSGVARTTPLDMEETTSVSPSQVVTGSQTITCTEVKADKAVYTVDRSGGLANLGSETWTVTKDGVFSKSSLVDVGDHAMELPASPKPGVTWKVHMKAERSDAQMDIDNVFKVVRKEKVTTKGGTFDDALLVEQIGTGTMQSKNVRTVSHSWYVKGLGLVKADMKVTYKDGTSQSVMVQETSSK